MKFSDHKNDRAVQDKTGVMNCSTCEDLLPDLLLEPHAAGNEAVRTHLSACPACAKQFSSLQRTMAALDVWTVPEPSPWFDSRMAARLREEQAASPAGFWERVRSHLLFNTGRQFRPAVAGALAIALIAGGGATAKFTGLLHPSGPEMSATVEDLQILDHNDQAIQIMDQLLDDDNGPDDSAPTS